MNRLKRINRSGTHQTQGKKATVETSIPPGTVNGALIADRTIPFSDRTDLIDLIFGR
jgi:hypothetical protein